MTRVLGIDPGGQTTALVVRSGRTYLDHALIHRKDREWHDYLEAVVMFAGHLEFEHATEVFACEDVVPPNPHIGRKRGAKNAEGLNLTNVQPLLDTSFVIGALLYEFRDVVLVRPGGHGKTPDLPAGPVLDKYMRENYPAEIVPDRDGAKYTDQLRHARSAWDVSLAAEKMTAQQRFGISS